MAEGQQDSPFGWDGGNGVYQPSERKGYNRVPDPVQDAGEYGSLEGQVIARMDGRGRRKVISVFRNGSWQKVERQGLLARLAGRLLRR